MEYISTRGDAPTLQFEDVIIAGLASDNGLYMPKELPHFTPQQIVDMGKLSYQELCLEIMRPFVGGQIDDQTLSRLIEKSYKSFRHEAIAPLVQLGHNKFLLELFHGPTLAFKDFALQFLGNMFDYILTKRNQKVAVLGATSGDTGSAAIYGCMGSKQVDMYILHPYQKISEVQRRQMTTVSAPNIHNLAIKSDFDFCQYAIKTLFRDPDFVGAERPLVAVNSINWCRIMAQIVYYFYSAVHLGAPEKEVTFAVPTGNLGDIFAGYIAKQMGLPIKQFIIATNQNDILHRFLQNNSYSRENIHHTISPSMDIQVSSNFERLLFMLHHYDAAAVKAHMEGFAAGNPITLPEAQFAKAKQDFASHRSSDEEICEVMKEVLEKTGELIDPHTATGIAAADEHHADPATTMVVLATAHPAKFPEASEKAGVPASDLPAHLSDLMTREESMEVLPKDIKAIKQFILST